MRGEFIERFLTNCKLLFTRVITSLKISFAIFCVLFFMFLYPIVNLEVYFQYSIHTLIYYLDLFVGNNFTAFKGFNLDKYYSFYEASGVTIFEIAASPALKSFIISVTVFIFLLYLSIKKKSPKDEKKILKGMRFLEPKEFSILMRKSIKKNIDKGIEILHYEKEKFLGLFEKTVKIILPKEIENEHFLITGSSGSGKTSLIRNMLRQIEERNQTVIVYDPEGEFIEEFYSPERGDVILNPLDKRCPAWSPVYEISDLAELDTIPNSLIKSSADSADKDSFFIPAARRVLSVVLEIMVKNKITRPDYLYHFFNQPFQKIAKALKGTSAENIIPLEAPTQAAGVIGNISKELSVFSLLPSIENCNEEFSIRDWVKQDKKGWVFLSVPEKYSDKCNSILSLWFDLFMEELLSIDTDKVQPIFVVIDEAQKLPQIKTFKNNDLFTRTRKRLISVLLGFQDINQMQALYGVKQTNTLVNNTGLKFCFSSNDNDTCKWVSGILGQNEVKKSRESFTAGVKEYRDGKTVSEDIRTEDLIIPSEISILPKFTCFIRKSRLDAVTKITIKRIDKVKKNEAFIFRDDELKIDAFQEEEADEEDPTEEEVREEKKEEVFEQTTFNLIDKNAR